MKYYKGDVVECPPSGMHRGNRIGKIIESIHINNNRQTYPILVKYIDFPEDDDGWFGIYGSWVHPIRKIEIPR